MRHLLIAAIFSIAAAAAGAADLTAVTLFLSDEQGSVIESGRWNSGPKDAAWDLFFYEGDVAAPTTPAAQIRWLNAPDGMLKLPLAPGRHRFTFHFDSNGALPRAGINLFFDGQTARPAISARLAPSAKRPATPVIIPNAAAHTMGWPITDVPAAAALAWDSAERGLWSGSPHPGVKITLEQAAVWGPVEGLDLVSPHAATPGGKADCVGQIVLKVEPSETRPAEWQAWLGRYSATGKRLGFSAADSQQAPPPFSFNYGGRSVRPLLASWKQSATPPVERDGRTTQSLTWTDPRGLQVRCDLAEYGDFPVAEWTVHIRNNGAADSDLITDLRSMDLDIQRRPGEEYLLRHWKGTFVRRDDFQPLQSPLPPNASLRFAPPGGRPLGHVFPYFNLEAGGEGLILAVGWPGQWSAQFSADVSLGLKVTAGQETTRFRLRPGEEVRTPLAVVLFWKGGDWIDAQNLWRRWMLRHNLPRSVGALPPCPSFFACSSHQFGEMIRADEASQIRFIDRYLEEKLPLDYWWMDAGWYPQQHGWPQTGTWEVDRTRFPRGLRAVSDHGKSKGVKTIVWFEPERVAADTWLANERPQWIIGGRQGGLLDFGNAEARQWLIQHIGGLIESEGIDLYRQDYNIDPLPLWRSKDSPDRQGITENHYVTGYLAYFDALRARFPSMLIDTCASGGHRNDLETLRRSIPLLRSDYIFEPTGQQGHTYGLAFWFPFFGTGMSYPDRYDPYTVRSAMCPSNTACFDVRRTDLDYALIRRLVAQWKQVAPAFYGDYYPLTPYSLDDSQWIAWQFHRPEANDGFVQAFRRGDNPFFGAELRLRGLRPDARYEIQNLDETGSTIATGRNLLERGLRISIPERPGAVVIQYRMAK